MIINICINYSEVIINICINYSQVIMNICINYSEVIINICINYGVVSLLTCGVVRVSGSIHNDNNLSSFLLQKQSVEPA